MNTDICPKCFQGRVLGGVCPRCGYVPEQEEYNPLALPHFSTLKQRYVTGKVLGIGGFGITYTAYDAGTGKLCCIKEYCPAEYVGGREYCGSLLCRCSKSDFEEGREHFLAEAEILDELRNNISVVDVWDCFEENGTAYYVMELLKGENLRQYRQNHDNAETKAVAIQMLMAIGKALDEIHRYGLLHGDVSPENIIFTEMRDMKLIDFGTARAITKSAADKDGKVYLKPSYAPLELYTLEPKQGPWCDVYSLAATYYTVVSGAKMPDARRRASGEKYVTLYDMNIGVSKELSSVIDRALILDYRERYQTMMEFMQDVSRVTTKSDLFEGSCADESETQVLSCNVLNEMQRCSCDYKEEEKGYSLFGWIKRKKTFRYLELLEKGRVVRRWTIPADKDMAIGRHQDSDIMTPSHAMISRRHCKIRYLSKSGEFMLTDTDSKYGTFYPDGKRMQTGISYFLRNGETFYLYSPRFTFRVVIES